MSTDEETHSESWYSHLNEDEREDLVKRVADQLEDQEGAKVPRRDLLKAAGVGMAGLSLGAGAVASGEINADDFVSRASAQSAAAGQVGTAAERVDIFASVEDAEELSTKDLQGNANWMVANGQATDIGDAINKLWAAGIGDVSVGQGSYSGLTTLDLANASDNFGLRSVGGRATLNFGTGQGIVNTAGRVQHLSVEGINFEVNAGATSPAFHLAELLWSKWSRCEFDGGDAAVGVSFDARNTGNWWNAFDNCTFRGGATTFSFDGGTEDPNANTFTACVLSDGSQTTGGNPGDIGIDYQNGLNNAWFGSEVGGYNNALTNNVAIRINSGEFKYAFSKIEGCTNGVEFLAGANQTSMPALFTSSVTTTYVTEDNDPNRNLNPYRSGQIRPKEGSFSAGEDAGAVRWFMGGVGSWDMFMTTGGHIKCDFSGTTMFTLEQGGQLTIHEPGQGIVVTSPDGTTTQEIGIDNTGAVVSRTP